MRPGAARRSPLSHGGGGLAIPAAGRRAARTASTSVAALPLAGGRAPTRMNAGRPRGGPRFDAWCRTDPATLTQRQADPRAQRAITARWAADPDPVATIAIPTQINQTLTAGDIVRAANRGTGSYHFCCPWSSIHQVRRPVRLGGRRLSAAQQFAFDVSGENSPEEAPSSAVSSPARSTPPPISTPATRPRPAATTACQTDSVDAPACRHVRPGRPTVGGSGRTERAEPWRAW